MNRISRIGSDRINISFVIDIIEPVIEVHFHLTMYFKYQVYRKIPFEWSENICDWLNGKKRSKLLDVSLGRALEFIEYDHKLECPLIAGNFSLKVNNVSLNEQFPMYPLLPSGQYLVDTVLSQRDIVFVRIKFYMAISDKRIEQYDNFDDLKELQQ